MKNLTVESTYDLINQLAKREEIDSKKIIEIVSNSFKDAYENSDESSSELNVYFDSEKKEFLAYNVYEIVEKINDISKEILKDDPRIEESEKVVDGKVFFNIDLKNLPKLIGYKVRKNIEKFILELRKERQYQNFLPLKGEIVSGHIQSVQENFCIINLGKGLGYWDKKEWNFGDNNYLGKNLKFLLIDVQEKADLKQLVLTRKGEEFVKKIFEIEVPEIKEGEIRIEKIIRIFGLISKVIVRSNRFGIDPVGTCIGRKGSRIKSIVTEMKRERIDLVSWRDSKREMLFNLMSPIEIISLVEKDDNNWNVIIPEHRMSLALYGSGKVIQKIGEYLNVNLHIRSFEKSQDESDIVIWNGNISFDDYEVRKNLFNSKQKTELN